MHPFPEKPRGRVLVADDEPALLEFITGRLDLAGYDTYYARDGVECLQRLAELRPAALVLDLNMPRMDGFEVLRQMTMTTDTSNIPTLVLTARYREDDIRKAVALGALDFLAKPFDTKQFLSRVARLVRRSRAPATPPPVRHHWV
jgi:DNA-binding response OmpR family regulator